MSDRVVPWRSKPTQDIVALFESLGDVRLYVVNRAGPTAFHIQEDGVEPTRRVILGVKHTCSCPELESVLSCSILGDKTKTRKKASNKNSEKMVRKPLDEEDPCPICYEDMQQCSLKQLVFCRNGCGRNVHGRCLRIWSEHQRSKGAELSCPLCRVGWGSFNWVPPPDANRKPKNKTLSRKSTHCSACKIAGDESFKCLTCVAFHLCGDCFRSGCHMEHRFSQEGDGLQREVARSEMMPNCTSILNNPTPSTVSGPKWGRRTQGSNRHSRRMCQSAPSSNSSLSDVSLGIVGLEMGRRVPTKDNQCMADAPDAEFQVSKEDAIDRHMVSVFGRKCSLRTAGGAGNKSSTIHRGLRGLGASRKRSSLPSISDSNGNL
ncbi:hypothetical protein BSKO_01310 [Bryopsis sp. KO-2023]|nr:hypothetical protein BSKO_01310 [Bryopsis sp. KO-2023]